MYDPGVSALDAATYEEWLATWAALWDVPELPARVRIAFSSRLRSSLGRCAPSAGLIRLNPGLLDGPIEALREVVCHEAAHVATWLLHGRRARAHGREFKELMLAAGYEARVRWAEAAVPESVRERRTVDAPLVLMKLFGYRLVMTKGSAFALQRSRKAR
jgi:predicted metal-dependent hydrolase